MSEPEIWPNSLLKDFTIKIQDGTHFSPTSETGPFRYITSKNIRPGRLDLTNCGWISEAEHRSIFQRCDPRIGDVLLTKDGANTGNAVVNHLQEEFSLLSSVALLRCDESRSSSRFLYQYLSSEDGRNLMDSAMSGNAITRLTLDKIRKLPIPSPPVEEQRRIAVVLDTIDETIQATERVIAKLRAEKAGLSTDAVLSALRYGRLVSIGHQIDETPDGLVQTGPFGSQLHQSDYVENGTPTFMPTDIRGEDLLVESASKIPYSKVQELRRHVLKDGDVLLPRRGDLSKCAVVQGQSVGGLCGTGCLMIRVSGIPPEWLATVYRHDFVQRQVEARAVGSTMMNLSSGLVRSLRMPLPTAISMSLMASITLLEQRISHEASQLDKLHRARSGLAADLLSGHVRAVAS